MSLHIETMSALWDGEPVDPDALAAALGDTAARAALVDFARMRVAVRAGDAPLPSSLSTMRRSRGIARVRLPIAAVAALLLIVLLTGWMLPRPWAVESREDLPPAPARTLTFEPGVDWQSAR
jgi:hypothetical protein